MISSTAALSRLAYRRTAVTAAAAMAKPKPTLKVPSAPTNARRMMASSSGGNPLEADAGALATHAYHAINLGLAVATPLYFLLPIENGIFGKVFGVALAGSMSAHSWVGLNYVGT